MPNCGGTPIGGPRFDEHLLSPVTPRAGVVNNVIQVPFQTGKKNHKNTNFTLKIKLLKLKFLLFEF